MQEGIHRGEEGVGEEGRDGSKEGQENSTRRPASATLGGEEGRELLGFKERTDDLEISCTY